MSAGSLARFAGAEHLLGVHVDGAGDVAGGIVFCRPNVEDHGIVAGVAVIQVGEQVGRLEGLESGGVSKPWLRLQECCPAAPGPRLCLPGLRLRC